MNNTSRKSCRKIDRIFCLVTRRRFELRTHCLKGSCSADWASGSKNGWDGRIWTDECQSQSLVPYRLATSQYLGASRPWSDTRSIISWDIEFCNPFFQYFLSGWFSGKMAASPEAFWAPGDWYGRRKQKRKRFKNAYFVSFAVRSAAMGSFFT